MNLNVLIQTPNPHSCFSSMGSRHRDSDMQIRVIDRFHLGGFLQAIPPFLI